MNPMRRVSDVDVPLSPGYVHLRKEALETAEKMEILITKLKTLFEDDTDE